MAEDIILLSLCSLGKEGVDLENLWETSMAIYIQKQQEQQLKQQLQQQLHKQQLHQLTDCTKQEQKQNQLEAMLDVELPAMRAKIDSLEINNADNVQEIAVLRQEMISLDERVNQLEGNEGSGAAASGAPIFLFSLYSDK